MIDDNECVEYQLRFRPKSFKQLYGQPEAVEFLQTKLSQGELPHFLGFVGDPGTGKTTTARVLKTKLDCSDHDFVEINCAEDRGIEMMRDIKDKMKLAPFGGKCKIYLLDEFHKATNDAMSASLKILEDVPPHVYFIVCTSDSSKIIKAVMSRMTLVKFNLINSKDMLCLLNYVCGKAGVTVSENVLEAITEVAGGSPRDGVKLLNRVASLPDEQKQLDAIQSCDLKQQSENLAKLLMNPRTQWKEVASVLLAFDGNPEDLRHPVLGYATSAILKGWGDRQRACKIIRAFQYNFYESRKAGLVVACLDLFDK